MKSSVKVLIVVVTLAVLGGLFWWGSHWYEKAQKKEIGERVSKNDELLVPKNSVRIVPEDASVTLVEFLDPECESCRAFYPHVKKILEDYSGKVRLVIRYAPFHPNARFAASILEAARLQERYWETLELMLLYQPQWGDHHHPRPEMIWTFLPQAKVDVERIRKDMKNDEIAQIIDQDIADGKKLGVKKTPSFFINGEPLDHFSVNRLREMIQKALE